MTASAVTVLRTVVGRLDVVRVPCPLCGESGRVLLRKNGMAVESCHRCGFLFVNPRPSPRALARMYNDDRGEVVACVQGTGSAANVAERREERVREALYRLARVREFRPGGVLVDIGCGSGETLRVASGVFDTVGVDASRSVARGASGSAPGRVVQASLERLPFRDGVADVALLTEVLEHAFDPVAALREAQRILRPRGLLVVQTGDADSLLPRMNLAAWTYVQPPVHLNFFTRRTLRTALRSTGFEILAASSFGRAPWMAMDAIPRVPQSVRRRGEMLRPLLDAAASAGLLSQLIIAQRV